MGTSAAMRFGRHQAPSTATDDIASQDRVKDPWNI